MSMTKSEVVRHALLASLIAGASTLAAAEEEVHRSNWVPDVGELTPGEHPLGDMWTFRCPAGGSVDVVVDTKDDTNDGGSTIDPVVFVFDGRGTLLGFGDDEESCTFAPVCGFECPTLRVACGAPGWHGIVVRDFGVAESPGPRCRGGGGYELIVEVVAANGRSLPQSRVKLGGGAPPRPALPAWARDLGMAAIGPMLDDQRVPEGVAADKATCIIEGPGSCEISVEAEAGVHP